MLTIAFKDGESRILNMHPAFFATDKTESTERKIKELIGSFGGLVHKAFVYKEGTQIYAQVNPRNEPFGHESPIKEDYKEQRKLRNEFKNQKFTQKWSNTTGIVTYLTAWEGNTAEKIAA